MSIDAYEQRLRRAPAPPPAWRSAQLRVLARRPSRRPTTKPSVDQKIMRGIMDGLGFKRDGEADINYRERAPLVIPPGRDLAAARAERCGDCQQSCLAERSRRRAPQGAGGHGKEPQHQRRAGARTKSAASRSADARRPRRKKKQARDRRRLSSAGLRLRQPDLPSELGFKDSMFGNDVWRQERGRAGKFTGEPPRTSLTDPPAGYQTPSPDQPYGLGKAAPPKATDDYTIAPSR